MKQLENISIALNRLHSYCKSEGYIGWENFDGLSSKIFRGTPFYRSAFFRMAWTQFFKRSPVNFRKLTRVPKQYNSKGLGLFASGLLLREEHEQAASLLEILKRLRNSDGHAVSWGYGFDWQTRADYVPLGTPTIIATVFAANAFVDYFEHSHEEMYLEIARRAAEFIVRDLILFENEHDLCLAYFRGSTTRIHNANMLGAAFLARIYSITEEDVLFEKSRKAMNYSVNALSPDFTWPYGESKRHRFIDNFHTGFNLVALHDWMQFTGEDKWELELEMAFRYFLKNFWLKNGCPKYYHNSLYPIDIHASAQGIVTCLKLARCSEESIRYAHKIAEWGIENMQNSDGHFSYQKTRWYANKIPYMRWSQAWMFYALSFLESVLRNQVDSTRKENKRQVAVT